MRILIAAFGNVLRGDDGFGIAVMRRLEAAPSRPHVELIEVGTGGLQLAQQLLDGYDRLIVVDAMTRGDRPGTLYVERVEAVEPAGEVDLHLAVPARALAVAGALGALPAEVYLVGCEPAEVDELRMRLSPAVDAAVDEALERIESLLVAPGSRAS